MLQTLNKKILKIFQNQSGTETTLTLHLRSPQEQYGQSQKANIGPVLVKQ